MANIKGQALDREIYIYSTREGSDGDPVDSHQSVVEAVESSIGFPESVAASSNTGSFNLISLFKRFLTLFSTVDTNVNNINSKLPTLGAKTTSQSLSVTLASDQSALPVSIASIPLATDAATATNQTAGNSSLSNINSKLPTLGTKTTENSLPVVLASDQPRRTVSMTAITLSAVSGDQTILTPTSGKSLQIFNVVLSNSTAATAFILKQGTTGQGQTNLTGTITAFDAALDFPEPLGLAVNRSFVINLPSSGTLRGYVTWREE